MGAATPCPQAERRGRFPCAPFARSAISAGKRSRPATMQARARMRACRRQTLPRPAGELPRIAEKRARASVPPRTPEAAARNCKTIAGRQSPSAKDKRRGARRSSERRARMPRQVAEDQAGAPAVRQARGVTRKQRAAAPAAAALDRQTAAGRQSPSARNKRRGARRLRAPMPRQVAEDRARGARIPTRERRRRRERLRPARSFDSARPAGSLRSG